MRPALRCGIIPVSYTHLDVYKRQDEDVFCAVDHPCFYEIAALRVHLNGDIRGFHLEFAVHQVARAETCLLYTSQPKKEGLRFFLHISEMGAELAGSEQIVI